LIVGEALTQDGSVFRDSTRAGSDLALKLERLARDKPNSLLLLRKYFITLRFTYNKLERLSLESISIQA
jgi:hypothetical protein